MNLSQAPARQRTETENSDLHAARARLLLTGSRGIWGVAMGLQFLLVTRSATFAPVVVLLVLALLAITTEMQLRLMARARLRKSLWLARHLADSAYLSELRGLPNRNYLLWQIRTEMAQSWRTRRPFGLAVLSVEDLDGAAERRGADFARSALDTMATQVERLTRSSDFAAYLEDGVFAVLLHDCTVEGGERFLRRTPPTLGVKDGKLVLELAVAVRLFEYDLESAYASDVLQAALAAPCRVRRVAFPEATAA